MDKREDLTRAERRYLERVVEAAEQELTLEEYYRASGLTPGVAAQRTSDKRLDARVRELACGRVDETAVRSAAMMRAVGEGLQVYLHRAPVDMRRGRRFHWPRLLEEEVVSLSVEQLNWLLWQLPAGRRAPQTKGVSFGITKPVEAVSL